MDLADQAEAVDLRHHNVDQHQIRRIRLEFEERVLGVVSHLNFEAETVQHFLHDGGEGDFVIDNQDALARSLEWPSGGCTRQSLGQ